MADAVRQRVVRLLTDAGRAPDVAVPAKQSSLVSALHGYPRFGTPRDLAPNANYIGGTISVAVPWLAVALTCLVLALGANLCCAPLRRRKRRARREEGLEEALKAEQKREDKNMNHGLQLAAGSEPVEHWPASAGKEERASRQDRDDAAAFIVGSPSTASISASSSVTVVEVSQLLWGVVLFNLAFLLVGIALIANFAFREGIIDVLDSIRYMKTRAAAPVALATFFVRIVERVATSSALSSLLSNISPALADTANLHQLDSNDPDQSRQHSPHRQPCWSHRVCRPCPVHSSATHGTVFTLPGPIWPSESRPGALSPARARHPLVARRCSHDRSGRVCW
jgi:hypothetical protein